MSSITVRKQFTSQSLISDKHAPVGSLCFVKLLYLGVLPLKKTMQNLMRIVVLTLEMVFNDMQVFANSGRIVLRRAQVLHHVTYHTVHLCH